MAGGGRDSGMKQQDKLGFQNGARNALKMFEIVIDICMYTYIRCTISDGHSAALLYAQHCMGKNHINYWFLQITRIFLLAMKKNHLGKLYI